MDVSDPEAVRAPLAEVDGADEDPDGASSHNYVTVGTEGSGLASGFHGVGLVGACRDEERCS